MADYSKMTKEQLQQEFSKLQRDRMGDASNSELYLKRMAEVRQAIDNLDRNQATIIVKNNANKADSLKFGTNTNADKPVTVPAETVKPKPVEPVTAAEEEIKPVPTPEELNKPEQTTPVQGTNTTNQFEQGVNKELGQEPSTTVNMPAQTITPIPKINSGKTYEIPSSAVAPADGGEPPKTGNEAWESVNGRMQVNNTGGNRKDDATSKADTIALRDYFQAFLGRAPSAEEYERIRTQGSTIQSVLQESQNPTQGQTGQQNTPTTQIDQEVANRQPTNTAEDIPPNPFDTLGNQSINIPSKPTTAEDIPSNPIPENDQQTDGLQPPPLPENVLGLETGEQPIPPPQFDAQGQPMDTSGMMKLGKDIQSTTDSAKDAVFQATAKGLGMQSQREDEARESGLSLTDYRQQVESLLDTSKKEGKESLRKMMAGLDRNEKRAFAQNLIYALGSIAAGLTGLQQGVAVGQYYKPEKVFNQGEADAREQNKYSADMEQQKQDLTLQLSKAKDLFDITQKYLDPAASAQLAQMAKGMGSVTEGNQTMQNFISQTMQNDTQYQQELNKLKLTQDWTGYHNLMAHRYRVAEQEAEQKFKGSTAGGKTAEPERLTDAMNKALQEPITLSQLPLHRRWQGEQQAKYAERYKPVTDILTPSTDNTRYKEALNALDTVATTKGENGFEPIVNYKKAFLQAPDEATQREVQATAANAMATSIVQRISGDLGVSNIKRAELHKVLRDTLIVDPELTQALSNPNDKKGLELVNLQRTIFNETAQDIVRFASGNFSEPDEVSFAEGVLGFATGLPSDEELNARLISIGQTVGVTNPSEVMDMFYRGFMPNQQRQGFQGQQGQQGQPRQRKPVNLIPSVSSGDTPKNNQSFTNIVDSNGSPVQGQYQGILLNQIQPNDKIRPGLRQGQDIIPSHMSQDQAFLKNISEIAKSTNGIMDEKALLTLMAVENISGLPNVINMAPGNKSTGATGLFQFLPATVFPYLKEKGVVQGEFDWNRRAEVQNTMANLTRTQQTAIFSDFLQDMLEDAQRVYGPNTKLTPGHIYAIHNQGAQGVRNMLAGQSATNKAGNAGLDLSNINNLINDFNRRIPETFTNESGQPIFGGN